MVNFVDELLAFEEAWKGKGSLDGLVEWVSFHSATWGLCGFISRIFRHHWYLYGERWFSSTYLSLEKCPQHTLLNTILILGKIPYLLMDHWWVYRELNNNGSTFLLLWKCYILYRRITKKRLGTFKFKSVITSYVLSTIQSKYINFKLICITALADKVGTSTQERGRTDWGLISLSLIKMALSRESLMYPIQYSSRGYKHVNKFIYLRQYQIIYCVHILVETHGAKLLNCKRTLTLQLCR